MNGLTRRHLLAALGASSWATASTRFARGAISTRAPLRFVGIYMPHGRAHELWQPRANFDVSYEGSSLKPFDDPATYGRSFKDRLLVLDGIDLTAGIRVGTTGHDAARVILTGSGADGKNPSIDQFLAVQSGLGADTSHASIALGVGYDQSGIGFNVSYAAGGQPIPKWIDPAQTFAELFGSPIAGLGTEAIDRQRRDGKSVLDFARADLARLRDRAGAAERTKIDLHAASLREIEKRLVAADATCPALPPPDFGRFPKVRAYGGGEPYFDAITDLQIDLLARALACDVSRFATIYLADLTRTHLFPALPVDIHNEVAHRYDARTDKHGGEPSTWHALAAQNRYSYSKVARLLQRLGENGILDDTVVYVSSDMGDPARHSSRHVPTLILGGCGGHFRMGRYIDLRGVTAGVPNNRLLVSIAQAFGIEIARFGESVDPLVPAGRLEELYA